jgi:hypothetical protein
MKMMIVAVTAVMTVIMREMKIAMSYDVSWE